MSPHQAICHLSDSFLAMLGEKAIASPRATPLTPLVRFVALHLPLAWPKGIKTSPEVEQGVGGTPPVEFERDRASLIALIDRFQAHAARGPMPSHPTLGRFSTREWGIWGYRHLDHHLRQFGR